MVTMYIRSCRKISRGRRDHIIQITWWRFAYIALDTIVGIHRSLLLIMHALWPRGAGETTEWKITVCTFNGLPYIIVAINQVGPVLCLCNSVIATSVTNPSFWMVILSCLAHWLYIVRPIEGEKSTQPGPVGWNDSVPHLYTATVAHSVGFLWPVLL